MRERILKIVSFFVILLVILMVLSHIFIPKNNSKKFGMHDVNANGILGEPDNTIDLLVVGDSESYASIVPMKLWNDYGFTSYVCGTPEQLLTDSYEYVTRTSESQNLKMVILEADSICCEMSVSKPISKIAKKMMPVFDYHNRWKDLNANDFFGKTEYTWTNDLKGYKYTDVIKPSKRQNYMKYTESEIELSKVNKLYVKLINEFCKQNNIELIIVSVPSTKNWNYSKHNAVAKLAEQENIEFIDMNLLQDEIQIDWNNDTKDAGDHLNYSGAAKVTNYLGEYLNNRDILTDHREDEKYHSWVEAYDRCKNIIK